MVDNLYKPLSKEKIDIAARYLSRVPDIKIFEIELQIRNYKTREHIIHCNEILLRQGEHPVLPATDCENYETWISYLVSLYTGLYPVILAEIRKRGLDAA